MDLTKILCTKESRVLDSGGVFSFHGKSYKIVDDEYTMNLYKGIKIHVYTHPSYIICAEHGGHIIEVFPCVPPKRRAKTKKTPKSTPHRPLPDNPFNRINPVSHSHEESWDEMLQMINEIFSRPY